MMKQPEQLAHSQAGLMANLLALAAVPGMVFVGGGAPPFDVMEAAPKKSRRTLVALGLSLVWVIGGGAGAGLAEGAVGINAHSERTGQVANPRRAEDDLRELAKSIGARAGAGDVSGIVVAANQGLDIVFGRTQGQPYDGTPLVRDMSQGKGIRSRRVNPKVS